MANWVNEELHTYDMYGNQTGVEVYETNEEITSSEKSKGVRYSYDESNQMVQYETKGVEETEWTQAARNVYNGEGMRIRQYEKRGTTGHGSTSTSAGRWQFPRTAATKTS